MEMLTEKNGLIFKYDVATVQEKKNWKSNVIEQVEEW